MENLTKYHEIIHQLLEEYRSFLILAFNPPTLHQESPIFTSA